MAKPQLRGPTFISLAGGGEDASVTTEQLFQGVSQALTLGPHYRTALGVNRRNEQVMSWRLPNGNIVQMYINPQNFVTRDSKQITETRTKGGFAIQYWGENLTQITINGTTGSAGVQGINVLRDIYRSENLGFDLVASQLNQEIETVRAGVSTSAANGLLEDVATDIQQRNFLLRPSLAALATSVLLFYQGIQYKGFFKDFTVTESVAKLGLFDYSMTFTATETRGRRKNFMGWHKDPVANDLPGQLINGIGNSVRGLFGLSPQPPETFHPSTAPLSFGGNSLSSGLGFANDPLTVERTIFL